MAKTLTPQQRAEQIVDEAGLNSDALVEQIRVAIVENNNDLLERCRSAERQLENIKAGGPIIVCEKNRTILRVWNQAAGQWAESNLIHIPGKDAQ